MKMSLRSNSMLYVFGGAGLLVVLSLMFPMTTSLGQGIDEYVIHDWKGIYEPSSGQFHVRIDYTDGSSRDEPMDALPLADFVNRTTPDVWTTAVDFLPVLDAAHAANPELLEHALGTRSNVSTFLHPFSDGPVAYSTPLLQAFEALDVNPSIYGGPSVLPGSVPGAILKSGELHVDTAADGNTLRQCLPGQVPPQLHAVNLAASGG